MTQEHWQIGTEPPPSLKHGSDPAGALGTQMIVLGWCLWLVGTWAVTLSLTSSVPAARWLILVALMGLMLVWPAVRLSTREVRMRAGTVWMEWLCLVLVLQAAVWPLRIVSQWRLDQTAWLAGALAAWSLLTAAVVAMGMRSRRAGPRIAAMVACVVLVLGEPAVMALAAAGGDTALWPMRVSPLATVWSLVQPALNVSLDPWPQRVVAAGAAAVIAWLMVMVSSRWMR